MPKPVGTRERRATGFRGTEVIAAGPRLSTDRSGHSPDDLSMVVEIIDVEERLRAMLPARNAMIQGALVLVERVRAKLLHPAEIEHQPAFSANPKPHGSFGEASMAASPKRHGFSEAEPCC